MSAGAAAQERCAVADAPIGVFDSGVGGLTVLRALVSELPHERFVYLGDTARLPYGTKSPATVARYAVQAASALARTGIKSLIIACNTASAVGVTAVREHLGALPVLGVIEPGAEAACAATRSGHIAVIATEGTVRGGAYRDAILGRRPAARVSAVPAPLFVALAEEGLARGPIATSVARHYLDPLFADAAAPGGRPDTLVLGCTHFPVLIEAIRGAVGEQVAIVDSAHTTARSLRAQLAAGGLARRGGEGGVRFLATDGVERFASVGSRFLGRAIDPAQVELIDL